MAVLRDFDQAHLNAFDDLIAGLGYLADSLGVFLGQDLTISTYTFIGEVLLAVWLLIARGFRRTTGSSAERVRDAAGTATAPTPR